MKNNAEISKLSLPLFNCDVFYTISYPKSEFATQALGKLIGVICSSYHHHPYRPRTRPPKFITNQVVGNNFYSVTKTLVVAPNLFNIMITCSAFLVDAIGIQGKHSKSWK